MSYQITCEECGTSFEARVKTRRFCSTRCVALARERNRSADSRVYSRARQHEDKPCRICGEMFKPRNATSAFCSQECAKVGKRKPPRVKTAAKNCETCGEAFLPSHAKQRFCSQSCSGKASLPRMDPAERKCKVEGCTKMRCRTDPGYCHKHDYRYRFYGDPLAETTRQRRDNADVQLDVDWEEVDSTSYWKKNPTHCPSGHEYTEDNTGWRTLRDGSTRRICKQCRSDSYKRRMAGESPNRIATCKTCGKVWEASKFGTLPKFCSECGLQRQRAKSRSANARRRGQSPKGPTYTCTACGIVSPTPATTGMSPKLCDVCANQNILDQKRRLWVDKNLKRYSLTAERFAQMVEAQGNRCGICGTSDPGGKVARWQVDHDHSCCGPGVSCGKCVRGLLCSRCNTAVGLLNDDEATLNAALEYLRRPPAQQL